MTPVEVLFLATYFLVLLVLSVYGSHRYVMAYLYYKYKGNLPVPKTKFGRLPRVTIQLPVYNEMYVVERLIDAGDRVVSLFRISAVGGRSGVRVERGDGMVWTFRDGKLARLDYFNDQGKALEAVGLRE